MTPPPTVAAWQTQMALSPESSRVLQNLLDEPCLATVDVDEFFKRVAARGPSTDAWEDAQSSVWEPPSLNFKRQPVPPGRFQDLIPT